MNRIKLLKEKFKKNAEQTGERKKNQKGAKLPIPALTGRKRANETYLAPEIHKKLFYETKHDAIIILDGNSGTILDINPVTIRLLGLSRKELLGKKFWEIYSFKDIAAGKTFLNKLLNKRFTIKDNLHIRMKDDKIIEIELISTVFNVKNKKLIQCIIRNITNSKNVIESLQNERNLLRNIIDKLPDAIYVKDENCRKTLANKADIKNMGLKSENDVLGKNDFEIFSEELAEGFFIDDQVVMQTGTAVHNREEYLFNSEGKKLWLLTSKIPFKDESDKIVGLIGIGRNITQRKELEESFKNERNLLQTIIDNIPDLVYLKDTNGRYVRNNKAHLLSLGAEYQEEVTGKSTFDFNPPELAKEYHEDEMRIIRLAKALIGKEEIALDRRSGKMRWHLTSKIPLVDSYGNVSGIIGISRDITEQKQAEEKIYKLNRVYEILSNVNQAIVRTRDIKSLFNDICKIAIRDGKLKMAAIAAIADDEKSIKIVASNGATGNYLDNLNFRLNLEEYKNSPSLIAIETMEYCVCNDIETDERMKPWRDSAIQNGYYSLCVFPLIVFGKPYGLIHFFSEQRSFFDEEEMNLLEEMTMDVSFCIETIFNEEKRRKSEEELIRAKEKAVEANRLKNSFLARMSHELRTPLSGILGSFGIIKEMFYNNASDNTKKVFDSIEEENYRLLSTMTELFDISSIESEDFKIDLKPLSLNDMVTSSNHYLRLLAERKNLPVEVNLPGSKIIVLGDEYCIKNILTNVLSNAIKFSNHGKIKITISDDEKYGIFTVEDEGVGISEDYQKHLFELFSQEDVGYSRPFDGAGLGLALVQRYVSFMNGDIKIKSTKGVGTEVTIKIPLFKN